MDSVFISPELKSRFAPIFSALGIKTVSDKLSHNTIIKNKVILAFIGTDIKNLEVARDLKEHIPVVFIDSNPENSINTDSIAEMEPTAILSSVLSDKEISINIKSIYVAITTKIKDEIYRRWFNSAMQSSRDAIIGIDDSNSIKFMNIFAQQLLGVEESKAVGENINRVLSFKNDNPLNQESKNTKSFENEVYNRITKVFIYVTGNVSTITDSYGSVMGRIITLKDLRELKSLFSRIDYQATHDSLTGILNRSSFINYAQELIVQSRQDKSVHGLIVISMDKFKIINDTCGHMAGDELLRKISYVLRDIDPDNIHIKGRISGDEFGIMIKNATLSNMKHFASNIKRVISNQDFIWGDKEYPIMCSYGIVMINQGIKDHYELFAAMDDACAISKENGGGRIEVYNDIDDQYNKRRGEMMWIHKLKEAIEKDRFQLYYQELLPVSKDDIKKIEILTRLKTEDGTILSPSDFIPSAELYGMMTRVDKIIIEKVASFCKELIDNGKLYLLSVNLSAASLQDKSLSNFIQNIFQKYKVPPTLFCFEITETTTVKNMELAKKFIKSLKHIGCTFSLDDFGSGFSNFTYLRDMDVDYLKIDGSFIENINKDPINQAMVESINNIGHIMKIKTVAEYVTNNEIKETLIKIGVDYLQGYEISKPTPIQNLLL